MAEGGAVGALFAAAPCGGCCWGGSWGLDAPACSGQAAWVGALQACWQLAGEGCVGAWEVRQGCPAPLWGSAQVASLHKRSRVRHWALGWQGRGVLVCLLPASAVSGLHGVVGTMMVALPCYASSRVWHGQHRPSLSACRMSGNARARRTSVTLILLLRCGAVW